MIIGRAICKILDGLTISVDGSDIVVQNNMGNQDALDKFIAKSDEKKSRKFPLNFYVINTVNEESNGWKYCETDLIIMMNTKEDLLYKERADRTYIKYIEPIYQALKRLLNKNQNIEVIASRTGKKYPYTDVPNFGLTESNVGNKKSEESVITDYVDARIIKLNFRIKTNCI